MTTIISAFDIVDSRWYLRFKLLFMVYFSIWASKTLQKSSAIQKISVTLSSVIIAIIVCKLLIFSTLKLQQFSLITKFLDTYISSNSRYNNNVHTRQGNRQESDGWGRKSYDAACSRPDVVKQEQKPSKP